MTVEENGSGRETELEKCFRELEQEWMSFNASRSHRSRRTKDPILSAIASLFESSPRQLLASLQGEDHSNHNNDRYSKARCSINLVGDTSPSEGRSRDVTDRSRFKGKRLLKLLDDAAETSMEEEVHSVCSSVVDQESVESRSCKGQEAATAPGITGRRDEDGEVVGIRTPEGVGLAVGRGEKVAWEGGGGGRWMLRMGWLSVFMLALALGIICMAGLDGGEEYNHGLVPT